MTVFLNFVPRWVLVAIIVAGGLWMTYLYMEIATAHFELAVSDRQVSDLKAAIADGNARAAEQSAALSQAVLKAQNEAKIRETQLRAAAVAAGTESDGLRDDIAAMRLQLGGLSRDAAVERASAIGLVLSQCAARHKDMAERCDRHVSDIRTLIDAWPKSAPPAP